MYPGLLSFEQSQSSLNRMLALSIGFHVALLWLVTGIHLNPTIQRPMSTYQVSLVSLSAQETAPAPSPTVDSPPVTPAAQERPTQAPTPPPPPMPSKGASRPKAPKVAPIAVVPTQQELRPANQEPDNFMQDVLRGIEPPPAAPTLGKLQPASPQKLRKEIDALLSDAKTPASQSRKSLSDDLAQLPAATVPPPAQAKAVPASKQKPETAIQVPGLSSNPYLARLQNKISSRWVAPPVDLPGQPLRVVIKFRLDRSGNVSDVTVETPSGNGYYDDAGRRAILKADPLPAVPADMSVPLDVHFSFIVGAQEAGG
jgi:TonB family protein